MASNGIGVGQVPAAAAGPPPVQEEVERIPVAGQLAEHANDLAAISLSAKIPEFWADMPRMWFAQFESIMAPQRQGDREKYNLVVAKLSRDAIQQVSDLIITPPERDLYGAVKARLLLVYEESAEKQFHKLVSDMQLGTQKPSQLLRRMAEYARNARVADETLKNLWISR